MSVKAAGKPSGLSSETSPHRPVDEARLPAGLISHLSRNDRAAFPVAENGAKQLMPVAIPSTPPTVVALWPSI